MTSSSSSGGGGGGGKAARARQARSGQDQDFDVLTVGSTGSGSGSIHIRSSKETHRASGGPPVASELDPCHPSGRGKHSQVVKALEALEQCERLRHCPHLHHRMDVPMDNHGSICMADANTSTSTSNSTVEDTESDPGRHILDLSEQQLRVFSIDYDTFSKYTVLPLTLTSLTSLNLSRNELWTLPTDAGSLGTCVPNLTSLDLSRNWFQDIPASIAHLTQLVSLNLSHNMLRSSRTALLLPDNPHSDNGGDTSDGTTGTTSIGVWQSLPHLQELDLRYNQMLGHQTLYELLQKELSQAQLQAQSQLHSQLHDRSNGNGADGADDDGNGHGHGNAADGDGDGDNIIPKNQNQHPKLQILMTISVPRPIGAFVGASAADRDARLLRSQLEPWSTTALRRRLVADFGDAVTEDCPGQMPRAQVMTRLLHFYQQEEHNAHTDHSTDADANNAQAHDADGNAHAVGGRKLVHVQGTRIKDESLTDQLLEELIRWKDTWKSGNDERPGIRAQNYMILTKPDAYPAPSPHGKAASKGKGGNASKKAKWKLKQHGHQRIWDLAQQAMASVDSAFAATYTAVAVTHNFQGSPHIDRQNLGPFYGMCLGNFKNNKNNNDDDDDEQHQYQGGGEIMVECKFILFI
jgi:hypothetical protein